MEIWKPVPSLRGLYEVSSIGGFRRGGRVLYQGTSNSGYQQVYSSVDGVRGYHLVHRLVLEAFVGPCPEGMEACHNNGDRSDNRLENLRWDTHENNTSERAIHGTCHFARRDLCPRGHPLSDPENNASEPRKKALGWRKCKACARADAMIRMYPDLRRHYQEVSNYYYENLGKRVFYGEIKSHLREVESWR